MTKGKKNQQTASVATTDLPDDLPEWLVASMSAFELLETFEKGDTSKKEATQQAFDAVMENDDYRGSISGQLGVLVTVNGRSPSIFQNALGTTWGTYMTGVAQHYVDHARTAGITPRDFSRSEGSEIWRSYLEKTSKPSDNGGIVSFILAKSKFCNGSGCPLVQWLEQDRKRDSSSGDTRKKVAAGLKAATNQTADPRKIIEDEIKILEVKEEAAALDHRHVEAQEYFGEIEKLREELAKLDANTKSAEPKELEPEWQKILFRKSLEDEIKTLETDEKEAVSKRQYDDAKKANDKIGELREKLAKLDADAKDAEPKQPKVEAPVEVQKETPETISEPSEPSEPETENPALTKAIAACEANGVGRGLKRLYKRWDHSEISDDQFVKMFGVIADS